MTNKAHWEKIYTTKSHKEVSWFAEHVRTSLDLIQKIQMPPSAAIIDIGGGASTLVDDLIHEGYQDLTVIDISGAALKIAQQRLAEKAAKIVWLEEDILTSNFKERKYDLWHDRAVFHFLTSEQDRNAYRDKVQAHVKMNGYLVLSTFADDGPGKCSGLVVKRYGEQELVDFFAPHFSKMYEQRSIHTTPSGLEQKFINVILKRT